MKYPVLAALAVAVASLNAADEAKPVAAAAPAAEPAPSPKPIVKDLTPEQQKQAFYLQGFFLAGQTPLPQIATQLELNDEELDQILAGIRASVKGEQLKFKPDEIIAGAEKMFAERVSAKSGKWVKQNEDFLAKVDTDKDIIKTASGLRYKILVPGTDPKPAPTNTVKCRYTGKLIDGKVFDSTTTRNNEPTEFPLNGVIPAWTEAVQKIGKGGKILLFAPAAIAYGDQGQGPIPGKSVLEFEVELVDFK
ncbi:MAG: FKBP-type peptidyl-prolyl cis-trans isomerase [Verrucomicrobiota bacterium]|jgi:FKBP-type peptidyl-prolyl cis-trans isomerase